MRVRSVVMGLLLLVGAALVSTAVLGDAPRGVDRIHAPADDTAPTPLPVLTSDHAVAPLVSADRGTERTVLRWAGWFLLGILVASVAVAPSARSNALAGRRPASACSLGHAGAPARAPPLVA